MTHNSYLQFLTPEQDDSAAGDSEETEKGTEPPTGDIFNEEIQPN